MEAWSKWFASFADKIVEQAHFPVGKEISPAGIKDLPLGKESITWFIILKTDNLERVTKIAQECPSITSLRVYAMNNPLEKAG